MRRILLLALFLAALPLAAPADDGRARRMLGEAEAADFRGVGRLNVAGRRFCTAALVSDRLAVTAAHCLYHPRTFRPVPLAELRFVAGLRRDAHAALRGVARAAVPPDYVYDGEPSFENLRRDIALLELDAAIPAEQALAFRPGPMPGDGAVIEIVSYARDRAQAASIQDGCRIVARIREVAALDCEVNLGASGAPVLVLGKAGRELWAVVSSIGATVSGGEVTLAVLAAPELAALEAALAGAVPDSAGTSPASEP
ncbi:MAG TPA: trypsin-like serine protease [Amaricoccus sp.]|uniref:trypsin-like serine peptidase n=1 Tax=Amaricoccus sp. TaxID=1872485 RepID=UPI002D037F3B|nr:trypsin-like serine protease [Amaricoccus sp.]HMR52126.1 trypsin-like serine protease [Amaricoccus sp.]HMT98928.1 trypsin-like serine protease [Amaricoccus sp.]